MGKPMRKPRITKVRIAAAKQDKEQERGREIEKHWLFDDINAKTITEKRIIEALCCVEDDEEIPNKKGEVNIGNVNLLQLCEESIFPMLTSMMNESTTYGSTRVRQRHWQFNTWLQGSPLTAHSSLKNVAVPDYLHNMSNLFREKGITKLNSLILQKFATFKAQTKVKIGYGHGYYLCIRDFITNPKVRELLENESAQNLNTGMTFFNDVLMVDGQILATSAIKNLSYSKADAFLFPTKQEIQKQLK